MQVSTLFSRLALNEFSVFAENLNQWLNLSSQTLSFLKRQENVTQTTTLTENDYWAKLAATFSDEWNKSHKALLLAKHELNQLHSPDQTPLGLIGSSLESIFTEEAEERYNNALANFTLEDEKLHKNPEITKQYNMVLSQRFKEIENQDKLNEFGRSIEKQHSLLKEFMFYIRTLTDLPEAPCIKEAQHISLPQKLDLDHSDHADLIQLISEELDTVISAIKKHDGLKLIQQQRRQHYKPSNNFGYLRQFIRQMTPA